MSSGVHPHYSTNTKRTKRMKRMNTLTGFPVFLGCGHEEILVSERRTRDLHCACCKDENKDYL